MSRVLAAIDENGARAFRVFPRESGVLLAFAERVASDVVCGDLAWLYFADIFRPRRAYTFRFTPRACHI